MLMQCVVNPVAVIAEMKAKFQPGAANGLHVHRNSGAGGNWLIVDLGGPRPGVVVTARLAGGRELRRELVVGGSYLSSHDPRAHFGLGEATEVEELVIGFPDGGEIRLTDVTAGQILDIDPDDRA